MPGSAPQEWAKSRPSRLCPFGVRTRKCSERPAHENAEGTTIDPALLTAAERLHWGDPAPAEQTQVQVQGTRKMYSRAKLDLLEARLLAAA